MRTDSGCTRDGARLDRAGMVRGLHRRPCSEVNFCCASYCPPGATPKWLVLDGQYRSCRRRAEVSEAPHDKATPREERARQLMAASTSGRPSCKQMRTLQLASRTRAGATRRAAPMPADSTHAHRRRHRREVMEKAHALAMNIVVDWNDFDPCSPLSNGLVESSRNLLPHSSALCFAHSVGRYITQARVEIRHGMPFEVRAARPKPRRSRCVGYWPSHA